MSAKLKISNSVSLPLDAVTEKLAFLGRTGGGKTYAAMKLCELMLDAKAHVVVLDPVGKWHGLRLKKDGKSKGYAIPVFGGLYGDIPLESTGGKLIADIIIDKKISAIIDVSQFTLAEQTRFAYDWATQLYQRLKAAPSAIHLFIEESQEFIPQNISGSAKEFEARMLHAFERMWKLGRNCGIGGSLISQRPQEVNKKVLNMTECLFVFQMTAPQEKKAIREWVGEKGLDESVIDTLPYLKRGTCHVWSPVWLNKSEVIAIAPKETLDASATPKVGEKSIVTKELSPIDVEELKKAMADTIEKKKQEDPVELRKTIVTLQKELKNQKPGKTVEKIMEVKVKEPAFTPKEVKELKATFKELGKIYDRAHQIYTFLEGVFHGKAEPETVESKNGKKPGVYHHSYEDGIHKSFILDGDTNNRSDKKVLFDTEGEIEWHKKGYPVVGAPIVNSIDSDAKIPLSKCERAIMGALIQRNKTSNKSQLAILSGYSKKSSGYNNALSTLRTRKLIDGRGDNITLTSNADTLVNDFPTPPTGKDLQQFWLNKLGRAERIILALLIEAHPKAFDKNWISEKSGYSVLSSGFNNALSVLRTLELIEGRGEMKASDSLFE